MKLSPAILILVAGLLAILPQVAVAQNALGDGRGLEKDMRKGGTGNTPRKNFREEVARRNALVTGQIGGGKAFRGSAGYTAPTDFRGATAGDSTFAFRRDSMSSKTVTSSVRGTDSLRYMYTFSTGNARSLDRLTDKPIDASISGASSDNAERRGLVTPDQGALRSSSLYSANRDLRPAFVGYRQAQSGVETIAASSLLGVKYIPAAETKRERPANSAAAGSAAAISAQATPVNYRSAYEGVKTKLDLFAGNPGTPKPAAESPTEPTKPVEPANPDPTALPTPGDAASDQTEKPEWRSRLDELSERFGSTEVKSSARDDADLMHATDRKPTEYVPGSWRNAVKNRDDARDQPKLEIDERTLGIIRAAGGTLGKLGFGEGIIDDPFELHMRQGQRLLQDGVYFSAEERFSRALSYKAGDPMAMVGRIHAQIGAGLHVSAALNLQELLINHPELIAVRYIGGSIPSVPRLKTQADSLRERLDDARRMGVEPNRETALLLAYVGYQAELTADIAPSLDAYERGGSTAEQNLAAVLREIWLKPPAAPLAPIEPPAEAPVEQPAQAPAPQEPSK
jgi:hypothetical protein